jgi:CheY-like chemotaxis protein
MRILVVDDEPAVRESLKRSLRFEGYEVVVATDGAEALERVRDDRPDALALDVLMPRVDDLETCRRLRARGDDLPVLLLTAKDAIADRVNGLGPAQPGWGRGRSLVATSNAAGTVGNVTRAYRSQTTGATRGGHEVPPSAGRRRPAALLRCDSNPDIGVRTGAGRTTCWSCRA